MKTNNRPTSPTERLRPIFDESFKFKIGDLVSLFSAADDAEQILNPGRYEAYASSQIKFNPPVCFQISGRHMEECYGGIQCHYRVSAHSDGVMTKATFQEFALVSYDDAVAARKQLADARRYQEGE